MSMRLGVEKKALWTVVWWKGIPGREDRKNKASETYRRASHRATPTPSKW